MAVASLPQTAAVRSDVKRSHSSINPGGRRKHPTAHSPGHLPLHLQDPHYPPAHLRRRRHPSTLSTHSYDMNSPVSSCATFSPFSATQTPSSRPYSNNYFVFPPLHSPTTTSLSSSAFWVASPGGGDSIPLPFDHWQGPTPQPHPFPHHHVTQDQYYSQLRKPLPMVAKIKRSPLQLKQQRQSLNILELDTPPKNHSRMCLSAVRSLDLLDGPRNGSSQLRSNCSDTSFKEFHNRENSLPLPITPSGHTPSMRLSFDMLDKQSKSASSRSIRRPYHHTVHPIAPIVPKTFSDKKKSSDRKSFEISVHPPTPTLLHSQSSLNTHTHRRFQNFNDTDGIEGSTRPPQHYQLASTFSSAASRPYQQLLLDQENWYDGGSQTSLSGVSVCTVVRPHHNHLRDNNNSSSSSSSSGKRRSVDYVNLRPVHSHFQLRRE